MSTLDMTVGAGRRHPLRLHRWLRALAWRAGREWRLRRQVAFLLQQDDRMLRDLGLTRGEVERSVRWGRDA